MQSAHGRDKLIFDPPGKKDKIWKAIKYLTGVDLLDVDGSFLHMIDNFIEFQNKLKIDN